MARRRGRAGRQPFHRVGADRNRCFARHTGRSPSESRHARLGADLPTRLSRDARRRSVRGRVRRRGVPAAVDLRPGHRSAATRRSNVLRRAAPHPGNAGGAGASRPRGRRAATAGAASPRSRRTIRRPAGVGVDAHSAPGLAAPAAHLRGRHRVADPAAGHRRMGGRARPHASGHALARRRPAADQHLRLPAARSRRRRPGLHPVHLGTRLGGLGSGPALRDHVPLLGDARRSGRGRHRPRRWPG